jgi:hypothetical protein
MILQNNMDGLLLAQGSRSQIAQYIARGNGPDSFFITGDDDNLISRNIANNNESEGFVLVGTETYTSNATSGNGEAGFSIQETNNVLKGT